MAKRELANGCSRIGGNAHSNADAHFPPLLYIPQLLGCSSSKISSSPDEEWCREDNGLNRRKLVALINLYGSQIDLLKRALHVLSGCWEHFLIRQHFPIWKKNKNKIIIFQLGKNPFFSFVLSFNLAANEKFTLFIISDDYLVKRRGHWWFSRYQERDWLMANLTRRKQHEKGDTTNWRLWGNKLFVFVLFFFFFLFKLSCHELDLTQIHDYLFFLVVHFYTPKVKNCAARYASTGNGSGVLLHLANRWHLRQSSFKREKVREEKARLSG